MSQNKSKIIIEDYKSEFKFNKKDTGLNIKFNRVAFIFFAFFVIYLIYSIHLIHLGSRKVKSEKAINLFTIKNKLYRADIIDTNGNYLAKTDKSLIPEEKVLRMYPQKNLFSHVLGQIDDDNNGISGLEKSLNKDLRKSKDPIKLTLDKDIQFLIRKELLKYQKIFQSKGSAAILMNVNNGDILSLVSLPDFNPNERQNITDVNYINRVTKGTYELGSVIKTFTFANALNEKLIEPETEFLDLPKSISCYGFPIREYDNKIPSDLTA